MASNHHARRSRDFGVSGNSSPEPAIWNREAVSAERIPRPSRPPAILSGNSRTSARQDRNSCRTRPHAGVSRPRPAVKWPDGGITEDVGTATGCGRGNSDGTEVGTQTRPRLRTGDLVRARHQAQAVGVAGHDERRAHRPTLPRKRPKIPASTGITPSPSGGPASSTILNAPPRSGRDADLRGREAYS
jgi:hypothetical protein